MLMKLRGGTAHFHIETGRWRGVPREERFREECPSGDIENVGHEGIGYSTVMHGKPTE